MDIVQEFIKASLKEKIRSDAEEQSYCKELFIKSKAISEEDLAKYDISFTHIDCREYEYNIDYSEGYGSVIFDSEILFTFEDKITKARYDITFLVRFDARAEGRRYPGSYWDPPEDEDWLIGEIWDDGFEAEYSKIETNGPTNDELEEHLIDIVYNFTESDTFFLYLTDNLGSITGWEIR